MIFKHLSAVFTNVIFRKDKILEICENKDVLHLGFVQHADLYKRKIAENDWLHSLINGVAHRLVGIDYLAGTVGEIRMSYDYEIYFGDVMRLDEVPLDNLFDVIVCGELLEHIENPGLMLEGIKQFCHADTLVVFTTPNPWASHRIQLICNGVLEEQWLNPEHTMWFSFQTLKQILTRAGYRCIISDYYYAENKRDLLYGTSGFLGELRLLKRVIKLKRIPRCQFDGLFFVATPVSVLNTNA